MDNENKETENKLLNENLMKKLEKSSTEEVYEEDLGNGIKVRTENKTITLSFSGTNTDLSKTTNRKVKKERGTFFKANYISFIFRILFLASGIILGFMFIGYFIF